MLSSKRIDITIHNIEQQVILNGGSYMTKMIAREQIEKVRNALTDMEKPVKEKFSRKETVIQLSGTIKALLAKGWDFADIAAAMKEASDNTMNYRPNDLRKYYEEFLQRKDSCKRAGRPS